MKSKFLFAAVVAAMTASCTQDYLEAPVTNLNNRIAIESPTISVGQSASTRMTTANEYAGVKWEPGDGFGAMLVDQVNNLSASKWADKYSITSNYKATNYLFAYEKAEGASEGVFTTDAEMVEGNYIFYAPFNAQEDSRKSLTIKTPLVQEIKPSAVNSSLTAFFKDTTSPVFIAYKDLHEGVAETELTLDMYHIFGIPMITLDNQYRTGAGTEEDPFVYHDLTVTKIELNSTFMAEAKLDNKKVFDKLNKISKSKSEWQNAKYETAFTADLYASADKTADKITFNFAEGGFKVAKLSKKHFWAVIPAAKYTGLTATIYVTVDGKEKKFQTQIDTNKDFNLTAGLPYPAEEYNTDGSMKASKGTSFTFKMKGNLVDVQPATPIDNGIKDIDGMIYYINKVAFRGGDIEQVASKADVIDETTQFYFHNDANIVINDAFLEAVENSLIHNNNGTIEFINDEKIKLGNLTKDYTLGGKIIYNAGIDYSVVGNLQAIVDSHKYQVATGATINAQGGKTYTITNNGGIVNVTGKPNAGSVIKNNAAGTVNVKANIDANLTINNDGKKVGDNITYAYVNIEKGTTFKSNLSNGLYGKVNVYGNYYGTATTNYGEFVMKDVNAGLDLQTNMSGTVNNDILSPYVVNPSSLSPASVYVNVYGTAPTTLPECVNMIRLNNNITFEGDEFTTGGVFKNVKYATVMNALTITSGNMSEPANQVLFTKALPSIAPTWSAKHVMGTAIVNATSGWTNKYDVSLVGFNKIGTVQF